MVSWINPAKDRGESPTFWKLTYPSGQSDYKHSYVNGDLEHPFGLPGVKCDVCGAVYGGGAVRPFECPPKLRTHKNIRDHWPIPRTAHVELQTRVMKELGKGGGVPFVDLRPGDSFQPCYLDIPSTPRADFLWPGLGAFVVNDRLRDLFMQQCPNDIAACPVTLRRIGKGHAASAPPIPPTGEPEDIINEVATYEQPPSDLRYWEIIVLNTSGFPPGGTPKSVCSGCQRPEIGPEREIRMTPEMWNGHAMFLMATTLHIIITDAMRRSIQSVRPTNVAFKAI